MDEIILNILKDVPFTLAVGFIFFMLTRQMLTNSREDNASKDALIGRLIDLLGKLSNVVETLDTKLDTFGATLENRTSQIAEQTNAVRELKEEVIELKEFINADTKIRIQRTPEQPEQDTSSTKLKTS